MKRLLFLSGWTLCILACNNSGEETRRGDTTTPLHTPATTTTPNPDIDTSSGMGNATIGADTMVRSTNPGTLGADSNRR